MGIQPLARNRGFTLIELLVVLSIILMLGGFALHGVTKQSQTHYMDGLQNAFMTLLLNARNTAVADQVAVIVCPIRKQRKDMSDRLDCGRRNNWHRGVLAFTDHNGNRILDAEDKVVAELPGFAHATIRWRAFRNRSYLRFTTQGLTDWQNGHFLFCNSNQKPQLARRITLNYAGRLYTAPDRNHDGIHENPAGTALRCD
jgi:type IV fimbrial biogenesis protein FimT